MRKSLFFAGLAAAALTLVGCNKEADFAGKGRKVEIVLSDVATRTINSGMSTEWNAGDELSVFNAEAGTTTWSSNIKFTVQDAAANRASGEVELTADAYDWYAFYPYTSKIPNPTTLNPEGSTYERSGYTTVGGQFQTQKTDDNTEHLAGVKVPVFGNVKNVPAGETPVIEMKNAASVACFKVTNALEEQIRILSVKFTAPEDIVGTYYIDFSGTAPAFVGSGDTFVYDNVTVTNSSPSSIAPDSNGEFYAVIKPFTAAAGAKLKVEIEAESADGAKKATATKEITLSAATEFKSGFIKKLNIPFDVSLEETVPEGLPYSEAFKGVGIGKFSIDNVNLPSALTYVWTYDSRYGMKASAFVNGTAYQTESWLVSPMIDLTSASQVQLSFKHAVNQFASVAKAKEEATVWARVKGGEWTKLEVNYPTGLGWTFVESGAVDLSDFAGNLVQIGFKYTSTADKAGTWEIQDFLVQDSSVPEFGVEQATFDVAANVTSVTVNVTGNVAWTVQDASEGVTATPTSGSGAGTIAVSFPANTDPIEKAYSLKVVTDNAALVDAGEEEFVIDITQAAASTEAKGFPFDESFADGQGDFTIDDVNKPAALDYVWSFDTRGFMKASAFKSNTNYDAESWLISPVVDLATAQNPALTFAHATNYFSSVAKAQEETSVWVREEGGSWAAIEGVNYPTSLGWTFAESGSLDLSAYKGKKVQIGFKYTSTATKSGTWEIQNFKLAEASVGPVEPGVTTVSTTMEAYAKEHECTISENTTVVNYKTLKLDDVVTMSTTGEGNCGSFWYATGTQWRLYQNKNGNVVVSLASGYKLKSVSFVYEVTNTATLKDSKGAVVASGDVYETDASTVEFTVGNTASATNGQVRIKEVTIKYEEGQGTTPTLVDPTIEVSPTLSVEKGKTATIAVTTNSNGAKTWSSSDETVATVDNNGVVTGVKAGTATVTLSIAATSSYNAGSAQIAVTVTAPVDGNVVSMTMSQYVEEHNCTVSAASDVTMYKTLQLNASVRMSTTGEDNCGSFWNTSSSNTTKQWRLYQNKGGNVIVSVAQGCELKSVKLTFSPSGNGILLDAVGNQVASNATLEVSGSSVTYTVGNSEQGGTSGQIRITAVEVKYTGDGTTFPDEPSQPTETETKITMVGNATVYVGETLALNATSNVEGATITYESENPAIATVSTSGVVTGVAEGTVKVYARIAGVEGQYTDAERYCNVTVSTKPVATDGTEVFIFSELGYANQADVTTVNGDHVTLVFAKGEGSNAPKYFDSGTNVRMYKNNTLTVSSEKTITKIEFFCASGYDVHSETTFSTGTCSDNVWTGSAKSVELVNATSGTTQIRFTSIKVTYE